MYEESSCGRGQRLAVSGAQHEVRQTELVAADSDIDQGGSGCPDIRIYILGGGAISPDKWVRDMGPDTTYEEGVGRIPPQGGP